MDRVKRITSHRIVYNDVKPSLVQLQQEADMLLEKNKELEKLMEEQYSAHRDMSLRRDVISEMNKALQVELEKADEEIRQRSIRGVTTVARLQGQTQERLTDMSRKKRNMKHLLEKEIQSRVSAVVNGMTEREEVNTGDEKLSHVYRALQLFPYCLLLCLMWAGYICKGGVMGKLLGVVTLAVVTATLLAPLCVLILEVLDTMCVLCRRHPKTTYNSTYLSDGVGIPIKVKVKVS